MTASKDFASTHNSARWLVNYRDTTHAACQADQIESQVGWRPFNPTAVLFGLVSLLCLLVVCSSSVRAQDADADPPSDGTEAVEEDSGLRSVPSQDPAGASSRTEDVQAEFNQSIQELTDKIKSRQNQVGSREQAAEVVEQLEQLYEESLSNLGIAKESHGKKVDNLAKAQEAPQLVSKLKSPEPEDAAAWDVSVAQLTISEAEELLAQLKTALAQASTARTTLDTTINSRRARRTELPQLITDAREEFDNAPSQTSDASDSPVLAEAQGLFRESQRIMVEEQAQLLESELLLYEAESALLPLRLEQTSDDIQALQLKIQDVEANLANQRQLRINELARSFRESKAPNTDTYNQIRRWLAIRVEEEEQETSTATSTFRWRELSSRFVALGNKLQVTTEELEYWRGVDRNMRSRMTPGAKGDYFSGSNRWVVERLRKQRERLPSRHELLAQLRAYQVEMESIQSLELDLADLDRILGQASTTSPPQHVSISSEIVHEMREQASSYLSELLKLADVTSETYQFVKQYRAFIDKQLLWIPNADRLGTSNAPFAAEAFRWLVHFGNWQDLLTGLLEDVQNAWLIYLIIIAFLIYLLAKQSAIRARLKELCEKAERSSCTKFGLSLESFLLTLFISVPLPLILLFFTWRLNSTARTPDSSEFIGAVAGGCLIAAMTWFPMELLRQVCRPFGLGLQHFDWQESNVRLLRTNLRWLINFTVPLAGLVGMFDFQSSTRWEDSFGRISFILLMPLISVFFAAVLSPRSGVFHKFLDQNKDGWIDQLSVVWYPMVLLVPIAFAFLSFFGYHYTSQQLALRLIATLWVVVLFVLAYCLLKRWLVLRRRKLVVAQARQRLEEAAAQRSEASAKTVAKSQPKGEEQLDLVAVDQQTKRLLASICVVGSLVFSYLIWADVLPAISLLDSVELWEVVGNDPDKSVSITLSSLLQVVPIIILATVAARNLPGLLEIAFLQHLPLSSAARYAISTLGSYAIAAIGMIVAASVLGLRWDNIQWIVAGLGVGLGFGLQEIFANLVSGIILLFEQPIRVGDVVTVDGVTGTVARIRIRATTIVNWDRQELIVPNRELITGKLINWTLSDSTNRVVINVGIAYGSNVEDACELLRQICSKHPNLMRDPGPLVTFEGFGDNTLNLVVRAYLDSLDDRLSTVHSLHQEIYEEFNERKIEISFPQRDLHLRSIPRSLQDWLEKTSGTK